MINLIKKILLNHQEIKDLQKENKDLWLRLNKLEDIKRKYNVGDIVYSYKEGGKNGEVIELIIIGFASGINFPYIICHDKNFNKFFKREGELTKLKNARI